MHWLITAFAAMIITWPTPYDVPKDAYRITPPEIYHEWHTEAAHCFADEFGLDYYVSFSDVEWWAVPEPFALYGGGLFAGYYDRTVGRIYVIEEGMYDEGLIKHEVGHQALPEGLPNTHPAPPYGTCAPAGYFVAPWK